MTDTKHTPGPWGAAFGEVARIKAHDGQVAIATNLSKKGRRNGNEVEANARLIAAAPEMLDALKNTEQYLVAWLQEDDLPEYMSRAIAGDLDMLRATIAKAEGKS